MNPSRRQLEPAAGPRPPCDVCGTLPTYGVWPPKKRPQEIDRLTAAKGKALRDGESLLRCDACGEWYAVWIFDDEFCVTGDMVHVDRLSPGQVIARLTGHDRARFRRRLPALLNRFRADMADPDATRRQEAARALAEDMVARGAWEELERELLRHGEPEVRLRAFAEIFHGAEAGIDPRPISALVEELARDGKLPSWTPQKVAWLRDWTPPPGQTKPPHSSLLDRIRRAPGRKLVVFVVLVEDTYETVYGDGEYRYFKDAFFEEAEARRLVDVPAPTDPSALPAAYHLRRVTLTSSRDRIRLARAERRPRDHFGLKEIVAALEGKSQSGIGR